MRKTLGKLSVIAGVAWTCLSAIPASATPSSGEWTAPAGKARAALEAPSVQPKHAARLAPQPARRFVYTLAEAEKLREVARPRGARLFYEDESRLTVDRPTYLGAREWSRVAAVSVRF